MRSTHHTLWCSIQGLYSSPGSAPLRRFHLLRILYVSISYQACNLLVPHLGALNHLSPRFVDHKHHQTLDSLFLTHHRAPSPDLGGEGPSILAHSGMWLSHDPVAGFSAARLSRCAVWGGVYSCGKARVTNCGGARIVVERCGRRLNCAPGA